MYSPKSPAISKYFSPRRGSQPGRSTETSRLDALELSKTEEQQHRIKRILNDVRRGGAMSPKSVIIPQSELDRMKNCAQMLSREEIIQQRRIQEEQNEKQQAAAKAKKQRMMEIEAERRKEVPPSEFETEKQFKNESLQSRAQKLLNEDKDDVKHMNQMMLYAKVVTIRDSQLLEKKEMQKQMRDEEKRKDLLLEVERLKNIKYYEELERLKKEEQRRACMETIKQIKERELERLRAQEEVEREGREIVKRIKDMQTEESVNILARRQQQKNILDQIVESNSRAIANKHDKILKEREEEEKIAKYLIERAQKEAEQQAELKRIQDEKEREVQRLREMQEKASDRNAELDAIRAKRATELADRQARDKDRKEAEFRARISQDLLEARQIQALQKQALLQEQAKNERDEFQRIVHTQKVQADLELKVEHEKTIKVHEHAYQLKKQIALNEEKKKLAKREYLEEGKKIKDKLSNEKRLLEDIKAHKLEELVTSGISPKYTAELARKRIII